MTPNDIERFRLDSCPPSPTVFYYKISGAISITVTIMMFRALGVTDKQEVIFNSSEDNCTWLSLDSGP